MDEKKNQKIIVFVNLLQTDKNLILSGLRIAGIFNKELCLLYRLNGRERKIRNIIEKKLDEYLIPVKEEMPHLKVSQIVTQEKLNNLPEVLADDHEAILIVANALAYKMYATAGTRSPVPFLFVNPETPVSFFGKIMFPLDLRKENTDAALWCSWFGRFANSEVTVLAANEKSQDSQRQVMHNVIAAKKLFQKTGVRHKIFKGKKSSFKISFETMEIALSTRADLMVILGSSVITPLDLLLGLPERKIIGNAGSLPVLLVNPRRDNYILCD